MEIGNVSLSILRTGVTAMLDSMGSTFPKAAVATLEDSRQGKVHLARQCLIDEGPEVFWKTIFGSLFVKASRQVVPLIPEQVTNMFGEIVGAFFHWRSAADQSKNHETFKIANGTKDKPDFFQSMFNNYIKPTISRALKFVGLDEYDENVSFSRFGAIQLGLVTGGSLILRGAENENIPGMNMDSEDPLWKTVSKIAGYTLLEQSTHLMSQSIRYYEDFKKEFRLENKSDVRAKAIANAIHERLVPGNTFSAISGCLSTLWLGKYIPKSIAGAIGEAPMKGLERLLTLHLRRATKQRYDLGSEHVVDNYRTKGTWLENFAKASDFVFSPIRNLFIKQVIARIFKPESMSLAEYAKTLTDSFNMSEKLLRDRATEETRAEAGKREQGKEQNPDSSHLENGKPVTGTNDSLKVAGRA